MPPKAQAKTSKSKPAAKPMGSSGKQKKKKWSKGKVRDKLSNAVLFDQTTFDKLLKEVPSYKMITPSIVSERLKIRGSLARNGIRELETRGLIKKIVSHHKQQVYARATLASTAASDP
ncbi:hypothetical protein GJ496_010297 [Pomphorhynchus laevis]|nr:hypothetical protein GJ496_010297 [Pomphorhynchus laevis]